MSVSVPNDSPTEATDLRPAQQPTVQNSGVAERLSLQQIANNTAPQAGGSTHRDAFRERLVGPQAPGEHGHGSIQYHQ